MSDPPQPNLSPQEVQAQPAEEEEDDDAGPEDPLVLLGAALDHAYGVAADAERVGDAVHLLLRVLEHVALGAQVPEHGLFYLTIQFTLLELSFPSLLYLFTFYLLQ